MMNRDPLLRALAACLAVAALVLAVPALADLGPDVRMSLSAPAGSLPVIGQQFTCDLTLASGDGSVAQAAQLSSPRLPGGAYAWDVVSFPLPSVIELPSGQPQTFPVVLTCNDPTLPVEISLDVGGRSAVQRFYLLPQNLNVTLGGDDTFMAFDSDLGAAVAPDPGFTRPAPAAIVRPGVRDLRGAGEAAGAAASGRWLTVRGRFVYDRNAHDKDWNDVGDGRRMGADGVTVNVYDSDWDSDDLLAQQVLGPDGWYDLTFWYDQSEAPDVYVEFLAANDKVNVVLPSLYEFTYAWRTPVKEDYAGSDLNWGTRHPAAESSYPALHLLATATQSWRWLADNTSYGVIDQVRISWPDSDWPHYKPFYETIYIPEFAEWAEGTVSHEYGHHWQQDFTSNDGTDYCNAGGRCDEPGESCRHCFWCLETEGDALQEGLPDWMSAAVASTFPALYGFSALLPYDWESVDKCYWANVDDFDDPFRTEGALAAFLQDVCDSQNETDPNALPGGDDVIALSPQLVLHAQDLDDPQTPGGLIATMVALNSQYADEIWQAAANARFDGLDQMAPTAVAGLTSTSHLTSGDSPDGTVDLDWSASTDGFSGIDGYSVRYNLGSPLVPDTSVEAAGSEWTSPDLSPGTYWFTVRAVDREGNGGTHATFGPVTIRAWIPADLQADAGSWPYPIVPRVTNDATSTSAPLPSLLIGNGNTYMNLRIENTGEQSTSPTLRLNFEVDGGLWWYTNITTLQGFVGRAYLNLGPMTVPGGRHALRMWADANEQMPEQDETDNIYSRQFIWYPRTLNASEGWVARQRPSDAWGGFTYTLFGSPNCDGFVYLPGNDPFIGVVMDADNEASDFDLKQHTHSTSPTSGFGFADVQANSFRPSGCIEAVFANNDQTTQTAFDVGVVNYDFDAGGFRIRRIASSSLATDHDVAVTLSPIEPLALRHFTLGGDADDHGTVTLHADPAVGPVRMMLLHDGAAYVGLDDSSYQAVTDGNGDARIDFAGGGGTLGLAVWQDPRDVPAGGSGHFQAIVRAFDARPDLAPLTTAGWYAPLVPTNGAPGTAGSTPLPGALVGNVAATYINVQFSNQAAGVAAMFDSMVDLDGVPLIGEQIAGLAGFGSRISNFPYAQTVRGGRHTLSMRPDATDVVAEGDETNNLMGAQYVWSPLTLASGPATSRAAPPDPTGGFAAAAAWNPEPLWLNCDGLRTPVPVPVGDQGRWVAVATLPAASGDVDLRLHERSDSPTVGFRNPLAASAWSTGESDYVLANFRATSPRQFDVGAVGTDGTEGYRIQTASSTWLANVPTGSYGPFALGAGEVLALHEVWLDVGTLGVGLEDLGGDGIDWGLTLHRGQLPYHGKTAGAGIVGQAWIGGPGRDEGFHLEVPQAGHYCLVVWKRGASDADLSGQYRLVFAPGATAVGDGDETPTATAVAAISPNPFNPNTRISYALAQAGPVRLEVFDARGRTVRRLLAAVLPAGRHELVWDGRDDGGSPVASGTYFARLTTPGVTDSKKMQLIK